MLGAIGFPGGVDGAEFEGGLAAGFGRREACANVFGDLHGEVMIDFLAEAHIALVAPAQVADAQKESPDGSHRTALMVVTEGPRA